MGPLQKLKQINRKNLAGDDQYELFLIIIQILPKFWPRFELATSLLRYADFTSGNDMEYLFMNLLYYIWGGQVSNQRLQRNNKHF